jgi:hypothetical protein
MAGSAAHAARCRNRRRGSFMALPRELKCLLRMQKESEQRSTYFWIARLPEAQSLPLTSRKSACPPAALKLNYTCCRAGRKGIDVRCWPSADIRRVHVNVCFSGKSGHEFMSTRPTWGRDYGKTVHRQDWHDLRRRNFRSVRHGVTARALRWRSQKGSGNPSPLGLPTGKFRTALRIFP